ncbi:MAG: tetratricopeptide repeat protein [Muribaculaceae bacterium]|nr:tetratricopeptide repeat protein [Muribaculaceae bacterium]
MAKGTNRNIGHGARVVVTALMMSAVASAVADNNGAKPGDYLSRAVGMYQDANYRGCIDQLTLAENAGLTREQQERSRWYRALSAFNLGHHDEAREMFVDFLAAYPASIQREDARMYLGDCLFTENYAEALAQYLKVNPEALNASRRLDLNYRTAYCYLKLGEYDKALAIFDQLENTSRYGQAAVFYQGYVAYVKKDYDKAISLFSKVNTNEAPGNMSDYYLAQIYYSRGEYNKTLAMTRRLLSRSGIDPMFQAEANRLAGESLYLTDNAGEAIPYLKKYVKAVETPELSSLYILGLSEYQQGLYQDAANTLNAVTSQESSMGQNALVYVGQAMLKLGEKDAAIMAFDNALKLDYDPKARENAYYNYAVARYMGGSVPFGSSVNTFEEFLRLYPNSTYADDVRGYLVEGYMTDRNYDAALTAINRIQNPTNKILVAKQQVLYAVGSRDLEGGRVKQAIKSLEQADALSAHNSEVARYNRLALGEAYVRDGQNDKAVKHLLDYLEATSENDPNRAVALYDLGYARMGQKDWSKGATNFERLIKHPGKLSDDVIADAYNRLGDCRFYSKNWTGAQEAYTHAAEKNPAVSDYVLFQQGVIDGYQGDFSGKLSKMTSLTEKYPNSALVPEAMLESVESYLRLDNPDKAVTTLNNIISKYGSTAQGRQAMIQLAMVQEQLGQEGNANKTYRRVITTYPTSDEAAQALEILKRRAAAAGTMDELMTWANSQADAPKVDTTEADRISFDAAEQAWLEKDNIALMKKYVQDYPQGKAMVRALAYLMDYADQQGDDDAALGYATRIVEGWPDNAVVEDALAIKADIEYDRGLSADARDSWNELARRASTASNADMARLGLMRIARDLGDTDEMMTRANEVLASATAEQNDRTEATFTRGLALQSRGDNAGARQEWSSITSLHEDAYGARASVFLAQSLLDDKQLAEGRKVAQKFVNSGTSQTYWLARGFIVLSDISRAQGNTYEADAFLKALKTNYPGTETDIFTMIEERLSTK